MRKIDPYLDKSVVTYFHYVKLSILISQFLHFSIEQTRADLIIYEQYNIILNWSIFIENKGSQMIHLFLKFKVTKYLNLLREVVCAC